MNIYKYLIVSCSLALCGCVSNKVQMQDTGTLFGFRAKSPGTGGAQIEVDIGLMRFEHYSNPVSTNQLYVGPFSKHVDATLSLINQKAEEDYSTYPTSVNINTNGSSFSTRP